MKLLLDQHLSPRLVDRLQDLFPHSSHVSIAGLELATDLEVWEHARQEGFVLVTKDADFSEISLLRGFPPKIIWLRIGNCRTQQIEDLLRRDHPTILAWGSDTTSAVLAIFGP